MLISMSFIAYILVYVAIGLAMIPLMEAFHNKHGFVGLNYMRKSIPTGFGIFLYGMLLVQFILVSLWTRLTSNYPRLLEPLWGPSFIIFLVWTGLIVGAGWIDDTRGSRAVKGFKGHIGNFLHHGKVSTGLMKAGIAGLVSLWAVLEQGGTWYELVLRFMVIVLATNAVNLLDLRPGRAMKGFYLGSILLFLSAQSLMFLPYWLPLAISVLLVLPRDLNGNIMLGDTGANLLGFVLGLSMSLTATMGALIVTGILLIALHWTSERSSLTTLIERNSVLNSIDQWGRLRR